MVTGGILRKMHSGFLTFIECKELFKLFMDLV